MMSLWYTEHIGIKNIYKLMIHVEFWCITDNTHIHGSPFVITFVIREERSIKFASVWDKFLSSRLYVCPCDSANFKLRVRFDQSHYTSHWRVWWTMQRVLWSRQASFDEPLPSHVLGTESATCRRERKNLRSSNRRCFTRFSIATRKLVIIDCRRLPGNRESSRWIALHPML